MTDHLATVTRTENTASGQCCARRRAPRRRPTTNRRTLVLGLGPTSPAEDKGLDAPILATQVIVDLDRLSRIVDGVPGTADDVDMGSYEREE